MSWLKKSVKKLGKSAKKIGKKVVKNPLAIANPQTYFSGASAGAAGGAASGKSASSFADQGGSGAVLGGAALATAGMLGGNELGTVTDGVPLPSSGAAPGVDGGGFSWDGLLKMAFGSVQPGGALGASDIPPAYSEPVMMPGEDSFDAKDALILGGLALAGLLTLVVVARAVR